MLNFRQFDAGPDPFGRKFRVLFEWLQTAISIRHSDTVDVKFILIGEDGNQTRKVVALPHASLLRISCETGRALDDPWCSRLAALHLVHMVSTGEDMEKDFVTLRHEDLGRHAAALSRIERVEARAG